MAQALIAKVKGRVTVAEFKRAIKETGLSPLQCSWYQTKGRKRVRLCAACGLTIVGLHRGYYTKAQLLKSDDGCDLVREIWNARTDLYYVFGFTAGFDASPHLKTLPDTYKESRSPVGLQGLRDGHACARAVRATIVAD
jgi:hypothetical protein